MELYHYSYEEGIYWCLLKQESEEEVELIEVSVKEMSALAYFFMCDERS